MNCALELLIRPRPSRQSGMDRAAVQRGLLVRDCLRRGRPIALQLTTGEAVALSRLNASVRTCHHQPRICAGAIEGRPAVTFSVALAESIAQGCGSRWGFGTTGSFTRFSLRLVRLLGERECHPFAVVGPRAGKSLERPRAARAAQLRCVSHTRITNGGSEEGT